jgi:membrane protease subunit (stomatin/prohibitin family)
VGLLDNLKQQIGNQLGSQFIEIIQWLDDSADSLVYRFPVYNQEIKMGAQLTVRENQAALLINEGKAADLYGPGRYELTTQNMPILTDLRGWKYGFQSPFRAEVYFFSTRLFTDLKWGTTNPVMMRDAEFGMIRLRAFGTYAMKIAEPKTFFATIVGTQGLTTTEEITGQLRSTILSRLSDAIAESKIAALDIASKYDELSGHGKQILAPEFGGYGLELSRFFIENVSLPEEVEAAIDQRTKLGVLGDRMAQYTQLQAAEAVKVAAANPGGAAGAGVGIGAGIAMGGMMGGALAGANASAQGMTGGMAPPPPPPGPGFAAPRWSLTVDGKTYGPYSDDAVKGMVASGQVAAGTLAWKPGAAGWAPIATFEELAGAGPSSQAPPPPPPAR